MSHVMHVYFHFLFLKKKKKKKQGRQLFHFIPVNQLDLKITRIFWTIKLCIYTNEMKNKDFKRLFAIPLFNWLS